MSVLFCLLLAPCVQEAPPDREKIREWLKGEAREWCGTDDGEPLAKISNVALEELPSLIKDAEGDLRSGLVSLYARIVEWKVPTQTPSVILNIARTGDLAAAKTALTIMDGRAHAFLIEGLKRLKSGEATSTGELDRLLIECAGGSHSRDAGELLLSMIESSGPQRRVEIVDALGNLGYEPALEKLKIMAGTPGRARVAIDKINFVTGADRAAVLARQVRGKRMSGDFSWYRWALHWIVHLRLTDAAPALREEADDMIRKFGRPRHPGDFKAALLHAVHDLGGKLSAEETALLTELGRLPPAGAPPKDVEPLADGFAAGVWAPLEQRRKEAEARRKEAAARNAPPPRIPEEKLPRIMEDRIRFVMNLNPPDPSYLAPNAALALAEIERMLETERNRDAEDKLLEAYLFLARLRVGMKTPDVILNRARAHRDWAMRIVTTIADERAEAWFLEEAEKGSKSRVMFDLGRLSGDKVKEALLKHFRATESPSPDVVRALVDLGCVEILPDLKRPKGEPLDREKLEIFAAPDWEARLLAATKSMRMSGQFSWYRWGLDQIVRRDLKRFAPDLRAWYDASEKNWASSTDWRATVLHALVRLGAPISEAEREIVRKSGRGP